jgi:DNA-binding LytR/AlgR family response regulator
MKVLIVEDETVAYENLAQMIRSCDPEIEIVANTEGVEQTVRWLQSNEHPDLIFMDIHLSDGSAFNIFELMEVNVPIIFTTAYDQYAIDAFKVNSVDYLLKPVKPEALADALAKFRRFSQSDVKMYLERLMELRPEARYPERMLLRLKDKLIPIAVENVAFVYTADRTTQVYMNDGMCYTSEKSMEQIASQLDPKQFMRVNKQFLLSRQSVKEITIWFDNRLRVSLTVATPEDVYISKNKSSEFKAWLIN